MIDNIIKKKTADKINFYMKNKIKIQSKNRNNKFYKAFFIDELIC